MTDKVPEKLYIALSELTEDGRTFVLDHRVDYPSCTEYTRTDAFIEKAFEFFSEHLWEYIDVKNANCDTFINIDGDKLKEDFKKYMEV